MKISAELKRCRGWIENALAQNGKTHSFEDIVRELIEKRMQFWSGQNGCAITEIIKYPNDKEMNVFLYGGKIGSGIKQLEMMKGSLFQFGRDNGCTKISITGRRGWKKVLDKHGFKNTFITMERAL